MIFKKIFLIFVIVTFSIGLYVGPFFINTRDDEITKSKDLNLSSTFSSPIIINDFPGSLNNWSWAKSQGYCTGLGTLADPYVIKDHFFDTLSYTENGLSIVDSRKYFTIRNCHFRGHSNWAGIYLENVTNGEITKNSNEPYIGAFLWFINSSHNTITYNDASNGAYYGMYFLGSLFSQIRSNVINNNRVVNNSDTGIYFADGCHFNEISDNQISENDYGIVLYSSGNNVIKENKIEKNAGGIIITGTSGDNQVYQNCFEYNTLHALDLGIINQWDDGSKGNYWDNYTGPDSDDDGIGDIPYIITGSAGSQDNFPLMTCPFPSGDDGVISSYFTPVVIGTLFFVVLGAVYLNMKKNKFRIKD